MADVAGAPTYAWRLVERMAGRADEALVSGTRRFTQAELGQEVISLAAALWDRGVRGGDTVASLAYNPPESIFLQLALHTMGARSAWITPGGPTPYAVEFLRAADVDALVYDASTLAEKGAELVAAVRPALVLCYGPGGLGEDVTAVERQTRLPFNPSAVTSEPSSLFQTGGTTAVPKLIRHGRRFFESLVDYSEDYRNSDEPRLRHLIHTGTHHASSQTGALMTLFSGGTLFLQEGLEPEEFLSTISRERINSTILSPAQLCLVLDEPLLNQTDLSSLHSLTVAGSALAPARLLEAIQVFGPVLRPVYGMSECTFICAHDNIDVERPERLASCGQPYPGISVQVRGEDGRPLAAGADGEIWVNGPLVMTEYFADAELTAQTLRDGWLYTGDVGHLDDDGYLYIVDRAKDMIITGYGAVNVFSRPIEDALMSHPAVRMAAVIGVPHDEFGESVHACVVLAAQAEVTEEQLREYVTVRLNEVWAPQSVEFVDALPLTAWGKVNKKMLRSRYLAASPAGTAA